MSSSNHYKVLCDDLKHDLKRKRRELEDTEERLRKCEHETKKSRTESNEMLKLYHGLQRELQLAYERNAKLQVDKASYEALLDSERKEFQAYKRQVATGVEESKKLKDALCAMRLEKLELETKFNAIVMENKELRDRARQYEPRLREVDDLQRKIAQIDHLINEQLKPEIQSQNDLAQHAQVDQEQINRYVNWNDLLQRESEEKSKQLERYHALLAYCQRLEEKLEKAPPDALGQRSSSVLPSALKQILVKVNELRQSCNHIRDDFEKEASSCRDELVIVSQKVKELLTGTLEQSCVEANTL